MPNDLSPTGVLDVPAATTAVLHGMMSTLSEVLGGLDARMAAIEQQVREARAETGAPRALAQTVEAAVARLSERIEALEALAVRPARDEALHGAVEALRQSVDALAVRPVRDDALHAAVAEIAARPAPVDEELHAAVAALAARPAPVDEELHAAVAALAARPAPVDEELHAAVAALAARPAPVDEELRAAVATLAARPSVDPELRAAVASLAARPSVDEELRAAVADLAARPTADPELRAAIADLAARPTADPGLRATVEALAADVQAVAARLSSPEDPVRLGITSLHERLSVLLELAAQPPQPDDAVRAGLAALHDAVAAAAERDPSPDPALNDVTERLRRLEERIGAVAAAMEDRTADERLADMAGAIDQRLADLRAALDQRLADLSGAVDALPARIPQPEPVVLPDFPDFPDLQPVLAALADHPAAHFTEVVARMEEQVRSFVAQPGPGPAMAMVAAGLAERFEARTDALADLLTSTSNRLDALSYAPADLERIRTVVETQQGDLAAVRDTLRALADSAERHGAVSGQVAGLLLENREALNRELDRLQEVVTGHGADLSERVQAALEAAARADAHAAEMGAVVSQRIDDAAARLVADVQAMVATGQDPARLDAVAERISESVRKESELLTQRVASMSVAVETLRALLDSLVEETSNSIGRKATEVGRKLAADLGIKTKKAEKSARERSLGPGAGGGGGGR